MNDTLRVCFEVATEANQPTHPRSDAQSARAVMHSLPEPLLYAYRKLLSEAGSHISDLLNDCTCTFERSQTTRETACVLISVEYHKTSKSRIAMHKKSLKKSRQSVA